MLYKAGTQETPRMVIKVIGFLKKFFTFSDIRNSFRHPVQKLIKYIIQVSFSKSSNKNRFLYNVSKNV